MLPRTSTPPKPKQPNNNPRRANHSAVKPMFRCDMRLAFSNGLAVSLLVEGAVDEDTCGDAEDDADADGDESQACLGDGEVVRCALEGVGDGGEEEEEDAEGEGGVD
jgi:hypothetical protein